MNWIKKDKEVPVQFQDIETWQINRRKFLGTLGVLGIASQITFFQSCQPAVDEVYLPNEFLSAKQSEILHKIQLILFPNDGNGPSAIDINAFSYLMWVLSDDLKSQGSKDYIINGIEWTDEDAVETYGKSFIDLNSSEQELLIKTISEKKWGENWLSINLTFIFEALSLDPIYVGDTNKVGWNWLEHHEGDPRPTEANMYPNIFTTIHGK